MNFIIIGSTAAKHWFPGWRNPKDVDLLTPAKFKSSDNSACFVDSSWHELAEELMALSKNKTFLDPELLLTLKLSHSFWDIHWDKTVHDITLFQDYNLQYDEQMLSKLIPMWEKVHGAKRVNMNRQLDEFFTDAVQREYDHEGLHELLAFGQTPLHVQMRRDPTNARLTWADVQGVDQDTLHRLALEEMMVVAVERFGVRATSKDSELIQGMHRAHKQLATSMTKGWFAKFLILRRYHLLHAYRGAWLWHLRAKLVDLNSVSPPLQK